METFEKIINIFTYAAIGLAVIEVYLKVNKIWKRRGEKEVAESQSIIGLGLALTVMFVWTTNFILKKDFEAIADNGVYMLESLIFILIGSGIFVKGKKGTGFWKLIWQSIRQERKEANYLLKALSGKREAEDIIKILHQLAMIDEELHPNELKLIQDFAKMWNIDYDFEKENSLRGLATEGKFERLRNDFQNFLDMNPDKELVAQVKDIMNQLIQADDTVADEEATIFEELGNMATSYLNDNAALTEYHVLLVPQAESYDKLNTELLNHPNAIKMEYSGGTAYSIAYYYSGRYAEMMCDQYRKEHLMSVVYEIAPTVSN